MRKQLNNICGMLLNQYHTFGNRIDQNTFNRFPILYFWLIKDKTTIIKTLANQVLLRDNSPHIAKLFLTNFYI